MSKLLRTPDGYATAQGWQIRRNEAARRWALYSPEGELVAVEKLLRDLLGRPEIDNTPIN